MEQEKEEIVPRESNKIIIGSEKYPEDVTEVQLNKTPQTKTLMKTSKENLSLKPVPVKEKEDSPVEKTSLEPIPKKEKERTDSKGAKSKKVPEKEKEMISSEETCSTLVFQTQKDHIVPSENYEASQPSKELAIADEKQPGVQLKKTPQLKPSKEIPTESVSLKQKCDEEKILAEESSLKISEEDMRSVVMFPYSFILVDIFNNEEVKKHREEEDILSYIRIVCRECSSEKLEVEIIDKNLYSRFNKDNTPGSSSHRGIQ